MTRGEQVIAFIEEFCRVPEGALVGEKIKLADFQKKFIIDVYDGNEVEVGILSIARKNAKTATIACLVLAHLCGPVTKVNSQIISGARSRRQAALIFSLCVKMIRFDKRLTAATHVVPSNKIIVGIADNVEYSAISAEATTAHGLSPVLAILDEIGQIKGPTDPFIDAITSSQGAHEEPLLIAISTQAPSDADLLSIWIDDAIRSGDPHIVAHVYAAEKDCELLDKEQMKKANPALGKFRSEKDLLKQLKKAERLPQLEATARNLLLNQRVSLEKLWIAPSVWKLNSAEPDLDVFRKSERVALGLDLSARNDLTAAVISAEDDEGFVHVLPFVFTPLKGLAERGKASRAPYDQWHKEGKLIAIPGSTIQYDQVAIFLRDRLDKLGIKLTSIEFDRWRIDVFKKAAEDNSFADYLSEDDWKKVGQGFKDIAPRCEATEAKLLEGKIRHGNHPLLTMGAANAIAVSDPAGNIKLDKSKSTQRIDPIIALVMSAYAVTDGALEEFADVESMIA